MSPATKGSTVMRSVHAAVAVCLMLASDVVAQDSGWAAALSNARELVNSGAHRAAEEAYTSILGMSGLTNSARATAFFGRAFAAQQRLLEGDTAGAPVRVDAIMSDYNAARLTDAETYGVAIDNNIGVLLKEVGRAAEAVSYFRSAGAGEGRDRATFLLNTGENFEALEQYDSAAQYYRRALDADSTRSDALRALLRVQLRVAPAPTVLGTAERWRADSTHAMVVATALPDLLLRDMRLADDDATRTLDVFAATLPVARVGLASFDMSMRGRLRAAASMRPQVQDGINALIHAYEPREEPYVEPRTARWWHTPGPGASQRRAAWSSLLRWIGDIYYQNNDASIARGFYEASIGDVSTGLNRAELDPGALVPLALIYVDQSNTQGERNLVNLTRALFDAKGVAYAARDLAQIRQFHLTLASLYAARGQWAGAGAGNAEFQIEMLRESSRQLEAATGKEVYVPPELLEKLAVHYQNTNRPVRADSIKQQVRRDYIRKEQPQDAAAAVRKIESGNPEMLRSTVVTPGRGAVADPSVRADVTGAAARIPIQGTVAGPSGPVAGARVNLVVDGRARALTTNRAGAFSDSIPATAKVVRIRVEASGFRTIELDVNPRERITIRLQPGSDRTTDLLTARRTSPCVLHRPLSEEGACA